MADPRGLAAALAPFHEVRKHLQATQARLSALLTTITGEAAVRTGNLERLPAAARFNPFSVAVPFNPFAVLPKVVDTANAAETGAEAGARRADTGKRAAAAAGARPAASGSAALAGLARAADSLRQAPGRAPDLPPSAAALTAAALGVADASAQARAAAQAPAADLPANAQAAGDLIEALLKRHAPPRAATRLHGTGARSAPTSDDGDAAPARRTAAASAARTAPAAADHPAARDALNAGAAATRGSRLARGEGLEYAPPSRLHAASAPWDELADRTATRTIAAMDATPIGAPAMHAAALDHGDAVLRSLLDADPLRPTTGAEALDGATPASGARAPSRSPLQRAPSRLLATVGTGPVAQQPAAAASLHAAVQMPTGSAPGDSAGGLAENLDRLLREQAWLRGVDLT